MNLKKDVGNGQTLQLLESWFILFKNTKNTEGYLTCYKFCKYLFFLYLIRRQSLKSVE
jgi:hypothetical protein